MMRDYDKRIFHSYKIYNTDEIEDYLSNMASQGDYLIEMNEYQMFFTKGLSQQVQYSIVLVDNQYQRWEIQKKREQEGWRLVCEGANFQVYITTKEQEEKDYNLEIYRYEQAKNLRYLTFIHQFVIMGAILLWVYLFIDFDRKFYTLQTAFIDRTIILAGFIFSLISVTEMADTIYWINKCEQLIMNGKRPYFRYLSITKTIKSTLSFLLAITLVMLILSGIWKWIELLKTGGFGKSTPVFICMGTYLVGSLIHSKMKDRINKRGFWEIKFIEWSFFLVVLIYSIVL